MDLTKAELKIGLNAALFILAAVKLGDQPVPLSYLERFVDRPGKLLRTVRELERGGCVLFDPFQGVVRLRISPLIAVMVASNKTAELFVNERPLDAALAAVNGHVQLPGPVKNKIICPAEMPDERIPAGGRVENARRRFCLEDGYIADKLERHPKGPKLRRELAAQRTVSAQQFQKAYEENMEAARADLGWFLEARNPGARMNRHFRNW